MMAPFDFRLANLDAQIAASRLLFDERTSALETRVMATSFRLDEQGGRIEDILENYGQLSERVKRLEGEIKLCVRSEHAKPSPVYADKKNPAILPSPDATS